MPGLMMRGIMAALGARYKDPLLLYPEGPFCILSRCFLDFLHADPMNLSELLGDVADVGGLVAVSAARDGREERTDGLHEGAVQRDRIHAVALHGRVI